MVTGKSIRKDTLAIKWCSRIADIYLYLLLTLFILLCSPYEAISETKHIAFLILCGGFVVAIVISVIELLFIRQLQLQTVWRAIRERKTLLILTGLYLCFTIISALSSPYDYNYWVGMTRYEGLITQIIYCLSMLFIAFFGRLRKQHMYAFGAAMLVFCGICALQFLGKNPFYLFPAGYNYYDASIAYSGEYLGTIGNADLVSALLSVAILAFLAYIICAKDNIRFWLIIPLAACAVTLAKSAVAAGILSVIASTAILIPICLFIKKRKAWKYALAIEVAMLFGVLLLIYFHDFGGSGTLYELHELLHGNIQDSFGSSRIMIWRQVASAMRGQFLFGAGPDSMWAWNLEGFTQYIDSEGIDVAHNEYLNVAAQQGILAAASYLAILLYGWVRFLKSKDKQMLIVPLAAVTAYEIQAFFCFSMCMVSPIFFAFLGLLFSRKGAVD